MTVERGTALGRALRRAREGAGWSQQRLADAMKTTQATVSRWERATVDINPPSLDDVIDAERAMGLARGTILVAAGYLDGPTIEAAILADQSISDIDRQILLATVAGIRARNPRKRR